MPDKSCHYEYHDRCPQGCAGYPKPTEKERHSSELSVFLEAGRTANNVRCWKILQCKVPISIRHRAHGRAVRAARAVRVWKAVLGVFPTKSNNVSHQLGGREVIRLGHQHPFDAAAFIGSTAVSNVNRDTPGIVPRL